jgi:NADH-quinone oxidoreductase subunit L
MNVDSNLTIAAALAALFPLIGSLLWFWVGRKWGERAVSIGAVSTLVGSFICVLFLFFNIDHPTRISFFEWIRLSSTASVSFAFMMDPLSLALGLVVTGVGSLIHLYATSYMHGDESFGRFFSYLNLFVFSMLMLTFSDSLPGLFLGWEGVGVCSYLLISFWFTDEANAAAGKKAFVVNRVGDLGFLIAMFSLYKLTGSLNIQEILNAISHGDLTTAQLFWSRLACLGFILGAAGKSAQS